MSANQEFGFIFLGQVKVQGSLAKSLNLLLNYQYRLSVMGASNMAFSAVPGRAPAENPS